MDANREALLRRYQPGTTRTCRTGRVRGCTETSPLASTGSCRRGRAGGILLRGRRRAAGVAAAGLCPGLPKRVESDSRGERVPAAPARRGCHDGCSAAPLSSAAGVASSIPLRGDCFGGESSRLKFTPGGTSTAGGEAGRRAASRFGWGLRRRGRRGESSPPRSTWVGGFWGGGGGLDRASAREAASQAVLGGSPASAQSNACVCAWRPPQRGLD